MIDCIIIFFIGVIVGALVSFILLRIWANKQVYKRCELHKRFPKEWRSDMQDFYYRNQAENMLKYIDWRRKVYGVKQIYSRVTDTDWLSLFRLFSQCNALGIIVKLECIGEDGQGLEKDPELAQIEIQKLRNRLFPDIHAGFSF